VATPVGPAPRDPNDPDLWDWSEHEDLSAPRRRPGRALLAAFVVVAVVLLLVVSSF
jgi:hypothetical protein